MKSAILLESNDILIMTKVELEMDANAFSFQALVGLKDTMKFRLWHLGKTVEIQRERPIERKTTSDCFKYQIKSWEMLRTSRGRPFGQKDQCPFTQICDTLL